MHQSLQSSIVLKPAGWDFQPPGGKKGKRKGKKRKEGGCKFNRGGLFFSINNSFCRTGEGVKLDILEECVLQRRMTRNNEEILPQTLSPAEWRTSQQRKIKKLLNLGFIRGNNSPPFLSSTNIYCKATLRKHLWNALLEHLKKNQTIQIQQSESEARNAGGIIINMKWKEKAAIWIFIHIFFFFTGQWGQTVRH